MLVDGKCVGWKRTRKIEQYWSGDDLVVCFDHVTGDTHVLNEFSANLLELLSSKPISVEKICQLIPDLSIPEKEIPSFLDHINNILLELRDYGLVEQD